MITIYNKKLEKYFYKSLYICKYHPYSASHLNKEFSFLVFGIIICIEGSSVKVNKKVVVAICRVLREHMYVLYFSSLTIYVYVHTYTYVYVSAFGLTYDLSNDLSLLSLFDQLILCLNTTAQFYTNSAK